MCGARTRWVGWSQVAGVQIQLCGVNLASRFLSLSLSSLTCEVGQRGRALRPGAMPWVSG